MTSRRIALFDLDGTLTDPAVGIVASMRRGMTATGIDPDNHLPLEQFIGPPLQESFTALGLDASGVETAIASYREHFAVSGLFENEVYNGIPDVLESLRADAWELAVATSKPEPFAERILTHFSLRAHFSTVAGATLDGQRRHKADVIRHALHQLGDPSPADDQVVMIGDRKMDILGAEALGLSSIGVTWGYGSVEELIEAGPSALAATPADLLDLLASPSLR